jgi:hypothetical protein
LVLRDDLPDAIGYCVLALLVSLCVSLCLSLGLLCLLSPRDSFLTFGFEACLSLCRLPFYSLLFRRVFPSLLSIDFGAMPVLYSKQHA